MLLMPKNKPTAEIFNVSEYIYISIPLLQLSLDAINPVIFAFAFRTRAFFCTDRIAIGSNPAQTEMATDQNKTFQNCFPAGNKKRCTTDSECDGELLL
jgi:hypothetical protein